MAKSKSGGTRAMLRGRIANDVYSIGKDGAGKKQQVVRSLAEQVANPQTVAQMRGRMIMSTVMQFISGASVILDHSFDGVVNGQPSISEAIRRNYQLIKADVAAHPASGNAFGLSKYQEKGVKQGAYVVSDGKVVKPTAITLLAGKATIASGVSAPTISALKANLGFGDDDYITLVGITTGGEFKYVRLHLSSSFAADTAITSANIAQAVLQEGNVEATLAVDGGDITAQVSAIGGNEGVIVTKKISGEFEHSACTLSTPLSPAATANVALPTYPVGTQKFLNGGDVNGAVSTQAANTESTSGSGSGSGSGGGTLPGDTSGD